MVTGLGALALAGCAPARSESVRIVVGAGAGSASDRFTRVLARYLTAAGIGVSVENQAAGGGKVAAARLAQARADENLLAVLPTGLIYASLLQEDGVDWDMASFGWLCSFGRDRRVLAVTGAVRDAGFASLLEPGEPVILAATAAASPGYYEPRIIQHLTGARLRVVPGYVGGARNMALVSGEAQGLVASLDGVEEVLALPGARLLLRLNDLELPPGAASEPPPALAQFARGPDAAVLLNLVNVHADFGRIIALPPSAPPERLALWRERIESVLADPAFRSEIAQQNYLIEPTPGAIVAERMADLLSAQSMATREALRRALASA